MVQRFELVAERDARVALRVLGVGRKHLLERCSVVRFRRGKERQPELLDSRHKGVPKLQLVGVGGELVQVPVRFRPGFGLGHRWERKLRW